MSPFFDSWTWIMAWRDSRTHRRKLVLFMLAIVMGIAALTAINSFGVNLQRAVDDQAKSLLGADLVIRSRQPFTPDQRARLDSLGGERSREVDFASMAYFTASGGTRLVRVKTIEGEGRRGARRASVRTGRGVNSRSWMAPRKEEC